ncbi:hypothetical protein L204_100233 [Cryptococcus depauperatus]|nr:hypothetical protein L204_02288 [Cryptococcus depauperatus CBS 7855]
MAVATNRAALCVWSLSRQQKRTLASAVLLSSKRNWKAETVATLKNELKKRGLSQRGNKVKLVARLESAEVSSLFPPLPSQFNSSRSLSTTSRPSQSTKPIKAGSTSFPASNEAGVDVAAGVNTTGPGPQIETQRSSVIPDEVTPQQVTVAPGLPESRIVTQDERESLDVRIPRGKPDSEVEQVIPLTPDNFSSNSTLPAPSANSINLKVLTVASALTHPAGGPIHATHTSVDAHSLEMDGDDSSSRSLQSVVSSVYSASSAAWNAVGLNFPQLNLPQGSQGEYRFDGRPLNGREKTGVWILAGLVTTGLMIGGPKKKYQPEEEHAKVDASNVVKEDAK